MDLKGVRPESAFDNMIKYCTGDYCKLTWDNCTHNGYKSDQSETEGAVNLYLIGRCLMSGGQQYHLSFYKYWKVRSTVLNGIGRKEHIQILTVHYTIAALYTNGSRS